MEFQIVHSTPTKSKSQQQPPHTHTPQPPLLFSNFQNQECIFKLHKCNNNQTQVTNNNKLKCIPDDGRKVGT